MITLWIGLGGAVGAMARFVIGGWAVSAAWAGFPWSTFLINASGSFLFGYLQRALPAATTSARLRGFLTIGVCGGFTTFSAFDLETFALLEEGRYLLATAYSVGSVVTCIAGVFVGIMWGDRIRIRTRRPRSA